MVVHDEAQDRRERIHRGIGAYLSGIEDESLAPDEPCRNTLGDDHLEEAAEDGQPQSGTNLTQRGMIGQRLVEVVPHIPTNGEVVPGLLHQLAFRANPFKEHGELEAEKDLGIDGGASAAGIAVGDEIAHEGEIKDVVKMPVEMILGHCGFERDEDGTVEIPRFRRTEYDAPPRGNS